MQITYHHRPQPRRGCVFVGIFNTPLQYAQVGDAHPASGDINRGAVTTSITPYWRRRRLCGDTRTSPHRYNRGAVADPAAQLTIYMADDMPSRWQTMLNRGWSVSVTCGSQMHHICSASKMSNYCCPVKHQRAKIPSPKPHKLDFGVYFFKSKPPNRKDLVLAAFFASPLQGNHSKFFRDFP